MTRPNFKLVYAYSDCVYSAPNGSGKQNRQSVPFVSQETTSGVSRRKPKGWMPPSGYSFTKRTATYQRGRTLYAPLGVNSSSGSKYVGVVGNSYDGGSGAFNGDGHFDEAITEANARDDQGLRNLALIRARANLKGTDINLGVAWAEINRTADLVGSTTTRIAKSFRFLRRGQVRRAMSTLGITSKRHEPRGNSVPSKWLELQYGWKPLVSDVYGACDALSKRHKDDWRVTAKGRATANATYSKTRQLDWAATGKHGGISVARIERSAFVRIDALPSNEALISLASLGVTNPLLIAWELVPFSFVADWFVPVGSWLEGLDVMLGYDMAYTSDSFLMRGVWNDSAAETKISGNNVQEAYYSGSKQIVYLDRRASNGSIPSPRLPGFKNPLSFDHMANGLALLSQVFGKR